MFKNILIAYDGSEPSKKAVALAAGLAKEQSPKAVLWLVSVMDISYGELGEPYLSQIIEKCTRDGQDLIKEATVMIGNDVDTHTETLLGKPAECIIEVANTRACDLIVMGTRGLGLLEGLLLGSQAQKVISHAHCPVMVVK